MKLPFVPVAAATLASGFLSFTAAAQSQEGTYGYAGHGWGWHGGWAGMILGPVMMIAFVALIVVLVVLAVRWLGGSPGPSSGGREFRDPRPLDVLEDRFARGEIYKDEFEERRRVLRGKT
jgi:putative membrane protein